jgi:hypothetical protein
VDAPIQHRPALGTMLQFSLTVQYGWTKQVTDRRIQLCAVTAKNSLSLEFPKFDEVWPSTYLMNGWESGGNTTEFLVAVCETHSVLSLLSRCIRQ